MQRHQGFDEKLVSEILLEYATKLPNKPQGSNEGSESSGFSPDDAFVMEIKKLQATSPALTYKQATDFISQTKPELLKNYMDWTAAISDTGRTEGVS